MLNRSATAGKLKIIAFLFICAAAVIAGCGDTKKAAGTAGDTATTLEGIWAMAASQTDGELTASTADDEYTSITRTFKGNTATIIEKLAVGSATNYWYQMETTASFSIGGDAVTPAGAKNIDLTIQKATFTLCCDDAVAYENKSSDPIFGYKDWVKGVAKDILGRKQKLASTSVLTADMKSYSIYKINGSRLLFGTDDTSHDGSSEATRFVLLDDLAAVKDGGVTWAGLTGDQYPENNTPAFVSSSSNDSATASVITLANGYFSLNSSGTSSKNFWTYRDLTKTNGSKCITAVFRVRGTSAATTNSVINLDVYAGNDVTESSGPKARLVIYNSGNLVFETADGIDGHTYTCKLTDLKVDVKTWHIYQVQMEVASDNTSITARVFVDGSNDPLSFICNYSTVTTTSPLLTCMTKSNQLSIGDSSTNNTCMCDLDYAIWSTNGNFYPSEIKGTIPSTYGTVY